MISALSFVLYLPSGAVDSVRGLEVTTTLLLVKLPASRVFCLWTHGAASSVLCVALSQVSPGITYYDGGDNEKGKTKTAVLKERLRWRVVENLANSKPSSTKGTPQVRSRN